MQSISSSPSTIAWMNARKSAIGVTSDSDDLPPPPLDRFPPRPLRPEAEAPATPRPVLHALPTRRPNREAQAGRLNPDPSIIANEHRTPMSLGRGNPKGG